MKAWLVTGASRGLGRAFTEAALDRGDLVAGVARDVAPLSDLVDRYDGAFLPVRLDVTARADVLRAVDQVHDAFGRLDVVVNNAGYGVLGAIEEAGEAETRSLLETNLLGPMWVVQAALPYLRAQGSGHIVQVSSVAGVAAFPMVGLYCMTKWALEAMSESLAEEVRPFGMHVTLLEPGAMRTDWAHASMHRVATTLDAYADAWDARLEGMASEFARQQPGDPVRAAELLLQIVDHPSPPRRVLMGSGAFDLASSRYRATLDEWASWESAARAIDFPPTV
ncbi:short-subunit dehydrogenase [Blastococcus colisei]|uniref:Short-subunit dehydrogenase n=1 Tax=Blastococcus colisei TaxID=1564162 RepID=A0A543PEA1_9ACTN|nr:SDR family NAD(P)-dependent oxidoreductase [Blastococcus colisei]TQN42377.1 short-subunit dehydrogenase [Blastococcus colisei]